MNTIINGDYQSKYEKLKKIGANNFTEIYEAKLKNENEYRAIKIIKLEDIKLNFENSFSDIDKGMEEYKNKIKSEIKNIINCGTNNENSVNIMNHMKMKKN